MENSFSKIITLLFICFSITSQSQDKAGKQKQLETLLESKEFVFIPKTAIPQGFPTVNLSSSSNYLKIHPKTLEGNLPYFGRSYSATYGGDGGIQFSTAPTDYKLAKNKKNYEIKAIIKGENDNYNLNLFIDFDGSATLNISSNKRTSISYYGSISPPENKNESKD